MDNQLITPIGLTDAVPDSVEKYVEKDTVDFMSAVDPYMRIEKERLCVEAGFIPNRFFTKEISTGLSPVGDMVLIKIAQIQNLETASGLIVPMNIAKNARLLKGEVVAVGPGAAHIRPGMIVEFDQHATFNYGDAGCDTPDELVAIRAENVIFCLSLPKN